MGGDLSVERMLLAYQFGIFPWNGENEPIQWWHLSPRMVLYPQNLKISKSMRSYFNQDKYQVTFDTAFEDVLLNCGQIKRKGSQGTWLTKDLMKSLSKLHDLGYAHSVEVWEGERLVGGLYGIALGTCFIGESMFAHRTNASKFGFITLVRYLESMGYEVIDCQQETGHLASLGATTITHNDFMTYLRQNTFNVNRIGKWTSYRI